MRTDVNPACFTFKSVSCVTLPLPHEVSSAISFTWASSWLPRFHPSPNSFATFTAGRFSSMAGLLSCSLFAAWVMMMLVSFAPAVIVMPASRAFPLLAFAVNVNDVRLSEEVFDFSVIHPASDWAVAMG